jgi:quercetin dioxygenase-like cupin family protein
MNIKDNNCYKDARGKIQMVAENFQFSSISIIESEPGSRRAAHTHFNGEGHLILVTEGQVVLYERNTGTKEVPKKIVLNKGDLWLTPEKVDHLMCFSTFSVFHCYSIKPRDSITYEADTIRLAPDDDLEAAYRNGVMGL